MSTPRVGNSSGLASRGESTPTRGASSSRGRSRGSRGSATGSRIGHGRFEASDPNINPRLQSPVASDPRSPFGSEVTQPATPASRANSGPGLVPPTFALVVNKESRIRMREALANGQRMPRPNWERSANPQPPLTKEELDTAIRRLDRAVRWNTFLVHVNLNAHDVINSITPHPIDTDSYDFTQLRCKFADNVRSFKNKTLERFLAHVRELIKQETWLKDASDAGFKDRLGSKFNHQNWAFCYYYMKEYVDFEACSDLGKWYMENMYVNLGLEAKRFLNAGETKDAREKLLLAYDALALNEAFDDIDKDDFVEVTERYRHNQKRKKRDFEEVHDRFSVTRAPPKKACVAQTPQNGNDGGGNGVTPRGGASGGIFDYDFNGVSEVEYTRSRSRSAAASENDADWAQGNPPYPDCPMHV